eukprot:COSAG06_NODE_11617_length_1485_cov_1.002165_2_plen_54_part_00
MTYEKRFAILCEFSFVFVPSLFWQNDCFYIGKTVDKNAVATPDVRHAELYRHV